VLLRTCECGGTPGPTGECSACRRKRVLGGTLQAKLRVGEPGDRFEQEADRVAGEMIRAPKPRQRRPEEAEADDAVTPDGGRCVDDPLRAAKVGGTPLSPPIRSFFAARFGRDFAPVRVHNDRHSAASARAINARAFTVGNDVVFGAGQYKPETTEGRWLLAHELTHVIQQSSGEVIRRTDVREDEMSDVDRLEQLLIDDQTEEAIALMDRLETPDDVLLRADLRNLAVRAFNNEEMFRAVRALNGQLAESLQWMLAEGTNWEYVRQVIPDAPGKRRVREERLSDFVNLCNNQEMAEAVDLLGGDLAWKLAWMAEEGTSWELVEPKLRQCEDETQKAPIRENTGRNWKSFFIDLCNDEQMLDAVNLIGGSLEWKFDWMLDEGTDATLLRRAISYAYPETHRAAELAAVGQNAPLCRRLYDELSPEDARTIFRLIGENTYAAAALVRREFLSDWVIRDREATEALDLICSAVDVNGVSLTDDVIHGLKSLGRWDALLNNLPTGSSLTRSQKVQVRTLFDSPASNLNDDKELFEIRFDVNLVDNSAAPWDQASLAETWYQLDRLPDSLVADNSDLDSFARHTDPNLALYSVGRDRITLPGSAPGTWWAADLTVIHEVGHAVDELIDADQWYMNDAHIDWENFGSDSEEWLDAVIVAGGWGTVTDQQQRRQIREVFLDYYDDPKNTAGSIAPTAPNHPWNLHGTCPVVCVGEENKLASIIFSGPTLTAYGGRVFVRYPDYREFYSFAQNAQGPPDFVSAYGLSSPYDWFAEQFRDYFATPLNLGQNRPQWIRDWFNHNLPP